MSRKPIQSITRRPIDTSRVGNGSGSGKPPTLVSTGLEMQNNVMAAKYKDLKELRSVINNQNTSNEERANAQRLMYQASNAFAAKDDAYKAKYESVMNKEPMHTREEFTTLSKIGVSNASLDYINQNIKPLVEEFQDKSGVGKLIAGGQFTGNTASFVIEEIIDGNPKLANEFAKMNQRDRGIFKQTLQNSVEQYRDWQDDFDDINKPLDEFISADRPTAVEMFSATNTSTLGDMKTVVSQFIKPNDSVFESVTEMKPSGKEKDIKGDLKDNRAVFENIINNGKITKIGVSSPSGKDNMPSVISITGVHDDKTYKVNISPNEANQLNVLMAFAGIGNQPKLTKMAIDRIGTNLLDKSKDGILPIKTFGLEQNLKRLGATDEMLNNPEIQAMINGKVFRGADGLFRLRIGDREFAGQQSLYQVTDMVKNQIIATIKNTQ